MQKTCKQCGKTKPIESFYVNMSFQDMLDTKCKQCRSENQKSRYKENTSKRKKLMQELLKM